MVSPHLMLKGVLTLVKSGIFNEGAARVCSFRLRSDVDRDVARIRAPALGLVMDISKYLPLKVWLIICTSKSDRRVYV